jgi:hypothetical protein
VDHSEREILWRALTSSGGLARVDVSDDNDVDMSLFLTVEVEDTLAMVVEMSKGTISMSTLRAQVEGDFCLPHGDEWTKRFGRILVVLWKRLEEIKRNAQIPRPSA